LLFHKESVGSSESALRFIFLRFFVFYRLFFVLPAPDNYKNLMAVITTNNGRQP
jgi:hypothetical protein